MENQNESSELINKRRDKMKKNSSIIVSIIFLLFFMVFTFLNYKKIKEKDIKSLENKQADIILEKSDTENSEVIPGQDILNPEEEKKVYTISEAMEEGCKICNNKILENIINQQENCGVVEINAIDKKILLRNIDCK